MLIVKRELERAGCLLLFATVAQDTSPMGAAMLQLSGIIAEIERKQIMERTRRGRDQRVREGRVMRGRIPPFGYSYDTEQKTLRIEEADAVWVRHMYHWYASEEISLYEVACRLNAQGARTPEGAVGWVVSAVRAILRNEVYKGRWTWNRYRHLTQPTRHREERPREDWLVVGVPALVTDDVWARVQYRLANNRAAGWRKGYAEYLLKGQAFCGVCGRRLICRGGDNSRSNPYYECFDRYAVRTEGAGCGVCVRADALEAQLWQEVQRQLSHPALAAALEARAVPTPSPSTTPQDALRAIQRQQERLLDAYTTTEAITKQDFEKQAIALRKKAQALEAQAREEKPTGQQYRTLEDVLTRIREGAVRLNSATFQEKRQLVVDLDIRVAVTRDAKCPTTYRAEVEGLPHACTLVIEKPRRRDYKGG
jgi:site-specific DNA recombinase